MKVSKSLSWNNQCIYFVSAVPVLFNAAKGIDSWGLHMCFCRLNTSHYLQVTCMRFWRWHQVLLQYNHGYWCHLWFQCILGTLLGSGPSSSGRPKGRCRKQYLSKELLKVVSRLDSWSRTIDQYLWWASNFGEVAGVHKFMGNFLHNGCLVVIMADGLIEVMGI